MGPHPERAELSTAPKQWQVLKPLQGDYECPQPFLVPTWKQRAASGSPPLCSVCWGRRSWSTLQGRPCQSESERGQKQCPFYTRVHAHTHLCFLLPYTVSSSPLMCRFHSLCVAGPALTRGTRKHPTIAKMTSEERALQPSVSPTQQWRQQHNSFTLQAAASQKI